MQRRRFLQSAAAVVPVALADPLTVVRAQSVNESPTPAAQAHPVLADQDRFNETHTFGYSRILFKVTSAESAGNLLLIEHENLKGGGPPLHYHREQEEWFYVMAGSVLFQIGDRQMTLHAGESVLGPRKLPHAFLPLGPTPGHMLIAFSPAGRMEKFLRESSGPNSDPAFHRRFNIEVVGPPLTAP